MFGEFGVSPRGSRELLCKVACELNALMGLEPPIPLGNEIDYDELEYLIHDAATLVQPGDEYTALAWTLMRFGDEKFTRKVQEDLEYKV